MLGLLETFTLRPAEMSPEKVRLHSAAMLEIEAPGNNVVIRASKIDFQTG